MARIDRDLLVALAPHNETLTIQAAEADVAYASLVAVADADYRAAKYAALAGYELADLSTKAVAVAGMAAQHPLPWLNFRATIAAAQRDWFAASGQSLLFVMGAAINAANAAYQIEENALDVGYYTTLAGAQRVYAVTLANARYSEIVSAASAERVYRIAYADNGESWQLATASARRAERVGRETAERDYVASGDTNARDIALAARAPRSVSRKKTPRTISRWPTWPPTE
jgi:hypothetical protein